MAVDEPSTAIHRVYLKLPPFWQEEPAISFYQVEAQLATKGVIQQLTKYHFIVGALAPVTAREVCDVIATIPATNPSDTLKKHLISLTYQIVRNDAKATLSWATRWPETLPAT